MWLKRSKVVRSRRPPEGATQLEIVIVGHGFRAVYYRVTFEFDKRRLGRPLTIPLFVNVICALNS